MKQRRKFNNSLVGTKHYKLTVLSFQPAGGYGLHSRVMVQCECGRKKVMRADHLDSTQSCGDKACIPRDNYGKAQILPNSLAAKRQIFRGYRRHAGNLKLSFKLGFEKFIALCESPCHYCGSMPGNIAMNYYGHGDWTYNGIDRKNNDLGYTVQNTVPCCRICNRGKNSMPYKEFLKYITTVGLHVIAMNFGKRKT